MTEGTIVLPLALIAGAALLLGLLIGVVAARRGGRSDDTIAEMRHQQGALEARLAQLAESQQTGQAALARTLEDRLGDVSTRVGATLERTSEATRTTITDLRIRLDRIDQAQGNIQRLSEQVVSLQDILSNKQARGAFGELQLADLITAVLPPDAFLMQATLRNGRRCDCLLVLPSPPGPIAIDAKFPLEAHQAMTGAGDEATRVAASRRFDADVRRHVRDIRDRYIIPGETAECALMFVPSETVYAELHTNFRGVIEESWRARVFIVSPTTLWATLNTVRAILKDARMREQADVIQHEVRALIEDAARLDERVTDLRRAFERAEKAIDQIETSRDKIATRGRRISDMRLEEDGAIAETGSEPMPQPPVD